MNFAQVDQTPMNENVQMMGTILEFKGEGINQTSGKPWKKVTITDGNVKHQVTLRGTLPGPEMLNRPASFSISRFQGNSPQHGAYTGYSGFWNANAQVMPQSPVQPTIRPYLPEPISSNKKEPDWDKIAEGKVRHGIICAGIQSGQLKCSSPEAVLYWTDLVMNGIQ